MIIRKKTLEDANEENARKEIEAYFDNIDFSKVDNFKKAISLYKEITNFQHKIVEKYNAHQSIFPFYSSCLNFGENHVFSYILNKVKSTSLSNYTNIFNECYKLKAKDYFAYGKYNNYGDLDFCQCSFFDYYNLDFLQSLNVETLKYVMDHKFQKVMSSLSKGFFMSYYYNDYDWEYWQRKKYNDLICNVFSILDFDGIKEDVCALKTLLDLDPKKFEEKMRKTKIYDDNGTLRYRFFFVPFDLIKPKDIFEKIEDCYNGYIEFSCGSFFHEDVVFDFTKLKAKYIEKYCLLQLDKGNTAFYDKMLEKHIGRDKRSDSLRFKEFAKLIEQITDKRYKQEVLKKYKLFEC